ncbi:MAG: hypothetical protein JXR71_12600 [Bacteroidales bacterium]|nr:hypothetical protein [Bacteroidales bacterium]
MRKLSLIFGLVLLSFWGQAQKNPHGKSLKFDCVDCHTTKGWTFSAATAKFNHDSTGFKLEGEHRFTNCKSCHTTLVFSYAGSDCVNCHTDMHSNTVGLDCSRCHDTKSWIVTNITEIHIQNGFPLLGAHNLIACSACHTSSSQLEFQPLGVECINCHQQDFLSTTNPNHAQSGFSTNCIECHKINAVDWTSANINHDFFPLTKGHDLAECTKCHTNGLSEPLSPDCYSCHQQDFSSTTNPAHLSLNFSTTCTDCHTTDPGWKPARFESHDGLYFPIYSGVHNGEWDKCTDCHTQPETYTVFSCIDCHEHNQTDTDKEHSGISGYTYTSIACYACHPTGSREGAFNHDATGFPLDGAHAQAQCLDCHANGYAGTSNACSSCHMDSYNQAENHVANNYPLDCSLCHTTTSWAGATFDHNATNFPLTGAHVSTECAACHANGYTGTPTTCVSCHLTNFNETVNPNHVSLAIPNTCDQCHTTEPGWQPATFPIHNDYYALNGAHAAIANNCYLCHQGNYTTTANTCYGCHATNYNNTTNPSHTAAGFSTDCASCHSETAWTPATFDHDNQYFPIYSGRHQGTWSSCATCHTQPTSYAVFSCITCHEHSQSNTDGEHRDVRNYVYNSTSCYDCHPNGRADD